MRNKRELIKRRVYIEIRFMKLLFCIPFVVFLLIYIWSFFTVRGMKNANLEDIILILVKVWELIIPVTSVWWVFLLMQKYMEGQGRELLWCHNNPSKMCDIFVFTFIYCLLIFLMYLFFFMYVPNLLPTILSLIIQSIFMQLSLIFFILSFDSAIIGLSAIFILHFLFIVFSTNNNFPQIFHLYSCEANMLFSLNEIPARYCLYLVIILLLLYYNKRALQKPRI